MESHGEARIVALKFSDAILRKNLLDYSERLTRRYSGPERSVKERSFNVSSDIQMQLNCVPKPVQRLFPV